MKKILFLLVIIACAYPLSAQQFELDQIDTLAFTKVKPTIGADFAVQFQGISHYADSTLIELGKGINLPTANFNIAADLAPGIRVHLTTYLSSRHHSEAWVKDGYLLIDQLPFIHSDLLDKIMSYTTIKAGVMELNFGDAHFRRSDNGNIISNPFVGNYIMNAFTTAPGMEIMLRNKGAFLMGGLTSGSLKPALAGYSASSGTYTAYNMADELAFYFKAGYDRQLNEDIRLRASFSGYLCANNHFGSLYYGDRTGSRYYLIMNLATNSATDVDIASNHLSGTWGPGFSDELHAFMFNLFVQAYGLEFFGTAEQATGTALSGSEFNYSQLAGDLLYRFGKEDQFYCGGRYDMAKNDQSMSISRFQLGGGWLLTKDIILKAEYVNQSYNNFLSKYGQDAGFKGLMVEAGISF